MNKGGQGQICPASLLKEFVEVSKARTEASLDVQWDYFGVGAAESGKVSLDRILQFLKVR